MTSRSIDLNAKDYLYELNNTAHEYGFLATDWEFSLATDLEKKALEKKYYPLVFTEVSDEDLTDFFSLIQVKYGEAKSDVASKLDNKNIFKNGAYLCAFNPERLQ